MYGRDPPTLTQRYVDHKSLELPLPEPIPEEKRKKKKEELCPTTKPTIDRKTTPAGGFLTRGRQRMY